MSYLEFFLADRAGIVGVASAGRATNMTFPSDQLCRTAMVEIASAIYAGLSLKRTWHRNITLILQESSHWHCVTMYATSLNFSFVVGCNDCAGLP